VNQASNDHQFQNKRILPLVISLFFLWALTSNLLPILIPHFKKAFNLHYFKASLVDWAYWISYFVFAIPSGLLMKKVGYKSTIVTGLLLAALGAFLFPFAADSRSYVFFLMALFVVASGMTFLETAANPYIKSFGSPDTYPERLNFAQAFNGLGAVVATNILSHLILSDRLIKTDDELKVMKPADVQNYFGHIIKTVKLPYELIGGILLLFAILFIMAKLPSNDNKTQSTNFSFFNPLKYPQLSQSMIAQFFYIGAQICVSSFFINYAINTAGLSLSSAKFCLGGLLICFMTGRYTGAFLMKRYDPLRLLFLFALANILLCFLIVVAGGLTGVVAFFGVEFFMSIMYPTIFSFGVKNMKEKTELASSYMVMMIVGGAFLPMLLGYISDKTNSVRFGYCVPLLCFIIVLMYAQKQLLLKTKLKVKIHLEST
jgi:FHS family L-fucose permease-like MFS transporter